MIESGETIKTLGLNWNPTGDYFTFRLSPQPPNTVNSRRTVLSTIAKIYDPLGWLAPTTVKAKILLQQLWRTPCTWDDVLPAPIEDEWVQYLQDLVSIESIKIERRLYSQSAGHMELHGFCDASERAYAATIYMKIQHSNGGVETTLIAAKTKVAPLKTVSLPRLELCGALLLARLLHSVHAALQLPIKDIFAWTDSTITLAWIQANSTRWKTFVANRVVEIQEKVPAQHWHHVSGSENPADCASRGINPNELQGHHLWWNGPEWLKVPVFPTVDNTMFDDVTEQVTCEERVKLVSITASQNPMFKRYSTLDNLTRVVAYLFRFKDNCKREKNARNLGPLTRVELDRALFYLIKTTQKEEFPQDLRCLRQGNPLPAGSKLFSLNPFIDVNGVMRVGGRLRNSAVSPDRKFPILLPRKHDFTTLVVQQEHLRNLHAGPQLLLSCLQLRYWILCGRDVVRQHVRQCIKCHRQRAETMRPMMGDLPATRVTITRPFLRCGVDYAGPFVLRALKLRGQKQFKAYVALFICFVTHAIHLELVSDMTTEAFIAALKRFVSRRGLCSDIYSDQGSNFIGANTELKSFLRLVRSQTHNEDVAHYLSQSGVNWHFNPPAAPHFGGLWEAGVKSVKFHLRRVVGNVSLNFEEMSTTLCQIEACLNSRPLCPISASPDDLSALTPGHFLIGDALTAIPEPDYGHLKMTRLSRWQLSQRLVQHFWKRWSREYLSRLQQRPRSWTTSAEIKLNDLVLLKEDNYPPSKWKLGRVIQTHSGKDGVVRVVTVQTTTGELRRPLVKICKLPIESP